MERHAVEASGVVITSISHICSAIVYILEAPDTASSVVSLSLSTWGSSQGILGGAGPAQASSPLLSLSAKQPYQSQQLQAKGTENDWQKEASSFVAQNA